MSEPGGVILYDGVCTLCSRATRFVTDRDREAFFRFVPLQGEKGGALARSLQIDPDDPDSFAVTIDGRTFFKSDGVLAVLGRLPGWGWTRTFRLMPRAIRDRVYDFIARRRYRLFGRADQCILPDERIRSRFEGLPDPASGETHP